MRCIECWHAATSLYFATSIPRFYSHSSSHLNLLSRAKISSHRASSGYVNPGYSARSTEPTFVKLTAPPVASGPPRTKAHRMNKRIKNGLKKRNKGKSAQLISATNRIPCAKFARRLEMGERLIVVNEGYCVAQSHITSVHSTACPKVPSIRGATSLL